MVIGKIIWTLIAAGVIYTAVFILNRSYIARIKDLIQRHQLRKLSYYIANGILLILIAVIWVKRLSTIVTFLGIIGAGIAIALSEIILSLVGWFFIVFRRPFVIGDRIEVEGIKGDVIDIRIFQFSILEVGEYQSTGKIIHIPNSYIFRKHFTNQTMGFEYIWDEFSIIITFDSNWEKARSIVKEIMKGEDEKIEKVRHQIERAAKKFAIHYEKLTSIVYTTIEDSGIRITLRYLVAPRERRGVRDRIATEVLRAIDREPDITLAYPTYRIVK
ncbi:mechanosensitive ion channel family protein [candidate division WOR-3 bacterium]|uniref:Mechanosensitive ion channel family protein n=1 Tax=candidate division WOR-3 bacterium TaxID=2052148 RepID=A0A660SMW3_UNCW3|nr:MAG: mechanosensitive ion channel family protein [candidate division WOR-3 bacterium]